MMEEERVQIGDPPLYVRTSDVRCSEGTSSFEGAEPSTSGAPFLDPNLWYICEDWVSGLSNKKLGFISHQFRLGNSARWATRNERLCLPFHGFMTFSEAILKTGVYLYFTLLSPKSLITLISSSSIISSQHFTLFFRSTVESHPQWSILHTCMVSRSLPSTQDLGI